MASVTRNGSGYDVMVLAGSDTVQRFATRVVPIERPGLDGTDYQRIGRRARPFRVMTFTDAASPSEARQIARAFAAMQGELIDYIDENGYEWEDVLVIQSFSTVRLTAYGTGFRKNPGSSNYGVFTDWALQLTVEPAAE